MFNLLHFGHTSTVVPNISDRDRVILTLWQLYPQCRSYCFDLSHDLMYVSVLKEKYTIQLSILYDDFPI